MNSCVSCVTWMIAIPVLVVSAFVLGPWLWVLVAAILIGTWWVQRSGREPSSSQPCCGRGLDTPGGSACCGCRCRGGRGPNGCCPGCP